MYHHLIGPTSKCDSLMWLTHFFFFFLNPKSKQHRTFGGEIKILKFQDVKSKHPKTSMMCFALYDSILIYFSKL